MRERPILFSGPMVRAILASTKTQTRRIVKPQPEWRSDALYWSSPRYDNGDGVRYLHTDEDSARRLMTTACPYGVPGDRLWMRETWQAWHRTSVEYDEWEPITPGASYGMTWGAYVDEQGKPDAIEYRATSKSLGPWTPSIHMPRWASRITLEVTGVRVERLQEISEDDAMAEGVSPLCLHEPDEDPREVGYSSAPACFARDNFRALWDAINGKRASWASNPWVWVVEFRLAAGQDSAGVGR